MVTGNAHRKLGNIREAISDADEARDVGPSSNASVSRSKRSEVKRRGPHAEPVGVSYCFGTTRPCENVPAAAKRCCFGDRFDKTGVVRS